MHASNILSHRMFVAALSPGGPEPQKTKMHPREQPREQPHEPPREDTMRGKTTRAAKRFVELTARPLCELDFGNQ